MFNGTFITAHVDFIDDINQLTYKLLKASFLSELIHSLNIT